MVFQKFNEPLLSLIGQAVGTATLSDGSGKAALAAGWVPGRGRNIFKLLRYHVKKNRAQVEALFPPGQDLDTTQVRSLKTAEEHLPKHRVRFPLRIVTSSSCF